MSEEFETQFDIEPEFNEEPESADAQQREDLAARDRLALQLLRQTRDSLTHAIQLLEEGDTARATRHLVDAVSRKQAVSREMKEQGARVVEGCFDGQHMMGQDGVRYDVPANYASKSKLVEGDVLKLVIRPDGSYVYKQIGPVERQRLVGTLAQDTVKNTPVVCVGDDRYCVLEASVSYHKAIPGDEVVIVVPVSGGARWAAFERIN